VQEQLLIPIRIPAILHYKRIELGILENRLIIDRLRPGNLKVDTWHLTRFIGIKGHINASPEINSHPPFII
jgi:hypothetical protein